MIISLAITIVALLLIVVSVLVGLKRGIIKSSVKAGGYIISALLAFLLAKPVSLLFSGLNDIIVKLLESEIESFSDITDASPTLVQLITKLPMALITPILFVILFFIIKLIVNIILKITTKPLVKLDPCNAKSLDASASDEEVSKRKSDISRSLWIGRAISIIPGLVLIFVLFLPVAGYLDMTGETLDALVATTENTAQSNSNVALLSTNNNDSKMAQVNDDYIKPANNNVFIKMVYASGGKTSFNAMTSFKLDGDKISIPKEIATLSSAVANMKELTEKPIKEYTKDQTDAIKNLTEQFDDSVILPKVAAEVLSNASGKWINNEKFFKMEKPSMSPTMDPLFNKMLSIFKTETKDTIKGDLNTLADIFVLLIDNNVLASVENQEELMKVLAKEGLITSLLTTLCENDRMAVLTNEVTNMGVRAIATSLKIPENKIAVHKEVVDSIKESAKTAITSNLSDAEKVTTLTESLNTVFIDNGMDVSADVTPIIAQTIIDKFKGQTDITSAQINDYFVLLSGVYEEKSDSTPVNQSANSPFKYLSVSGSPNVILCANTLTLSYEEFLSMYEKNKDKFTTDRYKLKGEMTTQDLYNLILNDLQQVLNVVEKIKESGETVNSEAIISLSTPEKLKTSTKTIDDLMIKGDEPIINRENAEQEGKKLEEIMSKTSDVITSVNNMNKAKDEGKNTLESLKDFNFNAMGEMLDLLGATTAFKDSTDSIAESMLDKVTGQRSNLVSEMEENDSNYKDLFQTVGDTTQVILGATDTELTDEEKLANIEKLMNNLTPSNAKIISTIISPKLLKDQGVPLEYTNKTSAMIKTLFTEMSKVELANINKESGAVKYLFDIGMSAKQNSTTPLFGENGKIKDTNDFINRCLTSTVVTNTLEKTVYDDSNNVILDPIGIKTKISVVNQNEVITALNKYISDNSITAANTEAVRDIVALAAMFNIETNVGASPITFIAK